MASVSTTTRREAILEAATELFLDVGFGATSMDAVVRRAGGSKSTIYAHFGAKELLFGAVVDSVLRELTLSVATDLRGMTLEDGLRRIGETLFRIVISDRHVALARLVIAEARRFPNIGRIYYDRGPGLAYRWITAFLRSRLRHVQAAEAAEWFAGRLVHRMFIERLCIEGPTPSEAEMRREVEATVAGFLRYLPTAGQQARASA